jgi:DNA-binding MarR family transcriptional regulator
MISLAGQRFSGPMQGKGGTVGDDPRSRRAAPIPSAGADRGPVSSAIFRVAKSHKALAGTLLASLGLYPGQEIVLMTLGQSGPLGQRELVRLLGTHPSTVTKMVQRLERAGFVRRSRSGADARAMTVELTDAGAALIARLHDLWEQLEQLTVAHLPPTEQKALLATLARLEASINAALNDRQPD